MSASTAQNRPAESEIEAPSRRVTPVWSGGNAATRAWIALSTWVLNTPWVVWSLAAVNLSSAVIGYIYWYGNDIVESPVYLWPFVPDSPLSVTVWTAAFLAVHYGRRIPLLGLLAVTGVIKYGLWTDWFWFVNALSGGSYDFEAVIMSLSHFGMVLEGLLLLPFIGFRTFDVVVVTAFYGMNDLSDYAFGRRPRIPNPEDVEIIATFSIATTVALSAIWFTLSRKASRVSPRSDARP